MSFTDEVKQELLHLECKWDCCARAEVCAALLLGGALSFRGAGRYGIALSLNRPAASRYYFMLIKKFLGVTTGIQTSSFKHLGEKTRVELTFNDEDVPKVMEELKLYDESAIFGVAARPNERIVEKPCCRAAFLKSAFIMTGYIANPEKEYALTLSASGEETADCLVELLARSGIKARASRSRSRFVVYVKSAEGVSVALTLMGAGAARLRLENARILKDIKNGTNRQTNCDSNNIERSIRSASARAEDIRFIAQKLEDQRIPDWAREIMSLRLENPDSSLSELGEMCDPPIGKSGVNNRLRRLSELAEKLRGENC